MEQSLENGDEEFIVSLRRERATALLLPLFFISGTTGLVYQTVWARRFMFCSARRRLLWRRFWLRLCGLSAGGFWMASKSIPSRIHSSDSVLEIIIGAYVSFSR